MPKSEKTENLKFKKQHGQYFTIYNPFNNRPFITWWKDAVANTDFILEPFAGANNLIRTLEQKYGEFPYESYDIEPKSDDVTQRDTLEDFPVGNHMIVTNPPYLAKNSAKRNDIEVNLKYDDLYKDCLEKMLDNSGYIAAIIPATFLHWGKMQERLYAYVMLTEKMFEDTETPVCLALFKPTKQKSILYYLNNKKVKVKSDVLDYSMRNYKIDFNKPTTANLALIAFDPQKGNGIKFLPVDGININMIKNTSRNIVSISIYNIDVDEEFIAELNQKISEYRQQTEDIYLTPFKGVRHDMKFRRRIMFKQARAIIEEVIHDRLR